MSVDLFVYRADGGISETQLDEAIQALSPDVELIDGRLRFRSIDTQTVQHSDGWVEPDMDAAERLVHGDPHVCLSGSPASWGWMLYVAAHLARELDGQAWDPQEGTVVDLEDCPSLEDLREAWSALKSRSSAGDDSSETTAQSASGLTWWEKAGWLDVANGADRETLDEAFDRLVEQHGERADAFMSGLLALDGVDEVYASDGQAAGFLAMW